MNLQWSLSALSLFERCKFAYKCRYVDKIPDNRPVGGPAQRGIEMHKSIEEFLLHDHPLPQELQNKWGYAFHQIKQFPLQVEHKIGVNVDWTHNPGDDSVWKRSWLRMVLDLKAKKPEGYTVYDWKTGKEYQEHYDQKQLYAIGVLSEHPEVRSVKAVHVYLDLGRQTMREYHRDQLLAGRAQWDFRVKNLERYLTTANIAWIPEPNFTCRYCAFSRAAGGPCKF